MGPVPGPSGDPINRIGAVTSLIQYLGNLGYGSRRDVAAMVKARRVTRVDGTALRDEDPWTHDGLHVDGAGLDPAPGSVLLLHKPVGYVCSTSDVPPLVYVLFPERFLRRRPVMATVGRLDRDTSGLLLLTDDGALNHRLTSPKSHLPKTYRATLANPLRGDETGVFASGTLQLSGDDTPLAPAQLMALDTHTVELTLTEGRYHQARRMFAAVGNFVVTLHRIRFGSLALDELAPGTWRELSVAERTRIDHRHR